MYKRNCYNIPLNSYRVVRFKTSTFSESFHRDNYIYIRTSRCTYKLGELNEFRSVCMQTYIYIYNVTAASFY